jgi:hypothetical protein
MKIASVALNPLQSLFGRILARGGRKLGNRQTETYSKTLAAHARRGFNNLPLDSTLLSTKPPSERFSFLHGISMWSVQERGIYKRLIKLSSARENAVSLHVRSDEYDYLSASKDLWVRSTCKNCRHVYSRKD